MSAFKPDLGTAQTVCYGFAMWAIGMWFGTQYVGRRAYTPSRIGVGPSDVPEWVTHVQTVNRWLVAAFVLGMAGVLVCDYYAEEGTNA